MAHRFFTEDNSFIYNANIVREGIYKIAKSKNTTYTALCYSIGLDGSIIAKSVDRYNRKNKLEDNKIYGIETRENIEKLVKLAEIDVSKINIKPLKKAEVKPAEVTKPTETSEDVEVLRSLKNYIGTQNTYLSILAKELEAIRGNQVEIIKMLEKRYNR